nr:hypothetical protein HK105_005546 [Polyrhizophydium stewartii]
MFGMLMAASEANADPQTMPDATISAVRDNSIEPLRLGTPLLYENAVRMCAIPGQMAFLLEMASSVALAFETICPMIPAFSTITGADQLSDKTKYGSTALFPLFWRYIVNWSQLISAQISFLKHFGWTNIAVTYSESGTFPSIARSYVAEAFRSGIQVGTLVPVRLYSGTGFYYPQIQTSFEYLRASKLHVITIVAGDTEILDYIMAANKTGMLTGDYEFRMRSITDVPIDAMPIIYNWLQPQEPGSIVVIGKLIRGLRVAMSWIPLELFTLIGGSHFSGRCRFRLLPVSLGLTVVLTCMIGKSYRLYVIFKSALDSTTFQRKTVTVQALLVLVGASCVLVLILCLVQAIGFPYETRDVYIDRLNQYSSLCVSTSDMTDILTAVVLAYLGALTVLAAAFAYINRILPIEFNDANETSTAVYILVFLAIMCAAYSSTGVMAVRAQFYIESFLVLSGVNALFATLVGGPVMSHLAKTRRVAQKRARLAASGISASRASTVATARDGFHALEAVDVESQSMVRIVCQVISQPRPSTEARSGVYKACAGSSSSC